MKNITPAIAITAVLFSLLSSFWNLKQSEIIREQQSVMTDYEYFTNRLLEEKSSQISGDDSIDYPSALDASFNFNHSKIPKSWNIKK